MSSVPLNRWQRALIGGMDRIALVPYQMLSLEHESWLLPNYSHRALLDTLLAYYTSGGLYGESGVVGTGASDPSDYNKIKSLRNPVAAFVDFYTQKLYPNPLTPVAPEKVGGTEQDNPYKAEVEAIVKELHKRSSFDRQQPKSCFNFSLFGEAFFYAGQREDGYPIIQVLDDRNVTEVDFNSRGFITWIRQDIDYDERDPETGELEHYRLIDVWQEGRHRQWKVKREIANTFDGKLPSATPDIDQSYREGASADSDEFLTFDFVPIAYAPFIQVDNSRGISPVLTCIEDIDEVNRMATNLHATLFRNKDGLWIASPNSNDATGRPMPVIDFGSASNIDLGSGLSVISLTGLGSLISTVPNIPYEQALNILNAQLDFISEQKLFELGWFKTTTGTEESGRARRYRLMPALERAESARNVVLDALSRVDQMCMTIGQRAGLPEYAEARIGRYEDGNFEHGFAHQDLIPLSVQEQAETALALQSAGGEIQQSFISAGFDKDEAEALASIGEQPEQ